MKGRPTSDGKNFDVLRERMVAEQIAGKGIADSRVLDAMRRVPRHRFVPPELEENAYEDRPLAIGCEQTISQPYMVAYMTEHLCVNGGEKVLEIGTGSGYQTAILCEMGARVYTVERLPGLADVARRRLEELGYRDVHQRVGDGTEGWPEEAPFDRVIVTAGAPSVPVELAAELAEGGLMLIPIGGEDRQDLYAVRREAGFVKKTKLCGVMFVKLVGREGWSNLS